MINDLYKFFGKDNKILLTILKNFLYSYRITSKNLKETRYKGRKLRPTLKIFHNVKVKRERREKGIPQGGVLSGLLANIYLYDFDLWISNILRRKYDLKYIRYADDFLILLKNDEKIEEIFKEVESQLSKKELKVHPLGEKSEVINLNERSTNYVGFEIKKNKVKVKKNNEIAFKNKIKLILNEAEKLQEFEEKKSIKVLNNIIRKINFKIIGNRAFYEKCEKCGKEPDYKNWIGYFGNITDVHQLKKIDRWIFNNLKFFMYKNFGFKIKKSNYYYLKANNFEQNLYKLRRLELEYYGYRKSLRKKIEFCKCTPKEKSEFEQY
ncbi:reverse transcriptase domain-containing protein [Cetobacterium somerae]|nr:reverse transcriptase domain-containing protein [Cetobacterium somerae]